MVMCNISFRSALITQNRKIVNVPIKKKEVARKVLESCWAMTLLSVSGKLMKTVKKWTSGQGKKMVYQESCQSFSEEKSWPHTLFGVLREVSKACGQERFSWCSLLGFLKSIQQNLSAKAFEETRVREVFMWVDDAGLKTGCCKTEQKCFLSGRSSTWSSARIWIGACGLRGALLKLHSTKWAGHAIWCTSV